jgi:peptidyl-prolyl cis-trans isomerase B (cyclophilin B)
MRLLALLLVALGLLVAGCGGDDDEATDTGASDTGTEETQTDTGTTGTVAQGTGATETEPGTCRQVDPPKPREDGGADPPEGGLDAGTTYSLVFTTNCGSFTVKLDQKTAPKTAASLVELARDGFYDDTIFHRIVPGFVIQGGDPTQTGTGGPGYSTVDPPPADTSYTYGTVAMAKTQVEPPGTSGSQFFVVTAPDAGLPAEYAVVGTISEGLAVVDAIGALGDQSQRPTRTVLVEKVTVSES